MDLTLGPEEVAVLRDVLTHELGDLSTQITHTDNPQFRRMLKERRDLLRGVSGRIDAAAAAGAAPAR